MKIGIIGQGYVGTAIKSGFEKHYDIETYDKYEDYYELAHDLNMYAIQMLELLETMYLDLTQHNKPEIATLNQTIKNHSKTESQLILFAFFLQLIIFIIIQFFEISSVVRGTVQKRRNK